MNCNRSDKQSKQSTIAAAIGLFGLTSKGEWIILVQIMETRNGTTIKLSEFKGLQEDLIENGYGLIGFDRVETGHFKCPKCNGEHGLDLIYKQPETRQERGFVLCLDCWHITKLLFIYATSS